MSDKTMHKKLWICLLWCGCALAQDDVEKAVVPLHDPARPVQIHAQLMTGGITVRGYDGKDVIVEARRRIDRRPRSERESSDSKSGGMKRIELPGAAGLDVVEEDNVVNIKTSSFNRPVDLVITVPYRASLVLKCMNDGDILVEHVNGEIDANNLNGKVTLTNISGSVLAHSLNGEVRVTIDRVDPSKPMSFSTMNGDIDVTFPRETKAAVRLKTDYGEIFSDYDLKPTAVPPPAEESGRQKDGTYRIRYDRGLRGTINGGGPEYQFTSFNGHIYIRSKK